MKLLNQSLLVLALVAIATSSSFAQPPGGRGGPGGQRPGRPPGGPGEGGGPGLVVLEALDTDGNHEISAEEITNSATSLKALDANEDGKLTDADLAKQIGNQRGGTRENRIGRQDPRIVRNNRGQESDHDGSQSKNSVSRPAAPSSVEQLIKHAFAFDADKDGKLSREEFVKFAESFPTPPPKTGTVNRFGQTLAVSDRGVGRAIAHMHQVSVKKERSEYLRGQICH